MKIAFVGSRTFSCPNFAKDKIYDILFALNYHNKVTVVSGGARGVDTWAEEIADELKIPKIIFKPDWNKYGKKAGFLRNQLIINESSNVIAFWDGQSKGTKHSIDLAIKAKKPIDIYIRS